MSNPLGLSYIELPDFVTESGYAKSIRLSYEVFGQALGEAPIVLVNHALTGNSNVAGENGWWQSLIGKGKTIDTDTYTVLAFNIPGNGYDGDETQLIEDYAEFSTRDIAGIFLQGLTKLNINKVFAIIGGSVGGGISWELAALAPKLAEHLIPVASDWKASDWLIANVRIQKQILENSTQPLEDARMHAMIFYRSAASFKQKFARSVNEEVGLYNIETWLLHHGDKLKQRFTLSAYKLLNHLLTSTDITRDRDDFADAVDKIEANIHLVNIDSDGFYVPEETRDTYRHLQVLGKNVNYHEIKSIHGHDAFLIEFEQLNKMLAPVFSTKNCVEVNGNSFTVTIDPDASEYGHMDDLKCA